MSIGRILAATDFSAAAGVAVERATQLANATAAELCLVHALRRGSWVEELGDTDVSMGLQQRLETASVRALDIETDRLRARAPSVRGELLAGALHREIHGLLLRLPAQLLVMGAHGAGGWQDVLLGSTVDRVLRLHRVPVLLVRNPTAGPYGRMALATDFSASSFQAARFALDLLPATPALLVHAHEEEFQTSLAFAGVAEPEREAYRIGAAHRALAKMERFARDVGVTAAVPALREGPPSRVLPELVDEASVELVVLGVSGRSGIEHGLLGSVSRHAAADLRCDVLLVPPMA